MMRWPSAYCAMSSGLSRSTMRSSTQPALPELVRTRYQSSITTAGLGGGVASAECPLVVAGLAEVEVEVEVEVSCFTGGAVLAEPVLPGAGAFAGLAGFFWFGLVFDCVVLAGLGALGAFFSAVARRSTSTFSPSLSW